MNFFKTFTEQATEDFGTTFKNNKVVHVIPSQKNNGNLANYYKCLALETGIPLIYEEDPITGLIDMNKWTEIKYKADKATETYKHSNNFQPLHTDYGYFSFEIYGSFIYCVDQATFGGATTFIDVDVIADVLEKTNPVLFDKVQKTTIHFGRKDNPLAHFKDTILSKDDQGWKINWNYYRALVDLENQALIEDFKKFLDVHIEKSGELKPLKLKPGEGVFFHDRRVLHGRNSFIGDRQLNKGGIATHLPDTVLKIINNLS